MLLLVLILAPFIGCIRVALQPSNERNREAWLAAAVGLIGLAILAFQFPQVSQGEVLRYQIDWMPAYGLNLVLRMDGLAWLFSLLIVGIFLLVVLYARYYMSPQDPVPRFYAFLLAFMGAMLGVVLSGNLVQLVLFWELTSLSSFLLIGYWHHRSDARRGARMAFTVTASGGLCLLAGVLMLGHVAGSYDLDAVLAAGDTLRAHAWYRPVLLLIALGALTKSAQFPFHFWLPHAMAAPTPVSAYLHSATMVKAGIFLLMRLWPVLSGTPEWTWLIGGAGVATLIIASFIAIFQHDLKGLLAYSTISHLGLITALLGMGTPLAMVAAIFHTLNHATFKASLFMAAGIIDHESGTRDMRQLRGLRHLMPLTATLAIVASAAMAGVPFLNGFLSKEMFFAETLLVGSSSNYWMAFAAVVMGIFSVAYSLRFIYVFFGHPASDLPRTPHEPPRWMRFPVEVLVLLCLAVGIMPALSVGPLLQLGAQAVLSEQLPHYDLAVWHGVNLPLVMSFITLTGGILLYSILRRRFNLAQSSRPPLLYRINGQRLYESTMLRLCSGASQLEKLLGTRRLQPQLVLLVSTCLAAGMAAAISMPSVWAVAHSTPLDLPFALLWLLGCVCAVAAAWQAKYHRLSALALAGGSGLMVCLTFLLLSAPDLALTQLMVETVTTVLILLGLRWLPPRQPQMAPCPRSARTARLRRSRDLALALLSGLAMAAISYLVLMLPAAPGISQFFLEQAVPQGGGTNVVNVLLVDFRGFDTLGEISVLAIVALTVYGLLRRFRPASESMTLPPQQTHPADPAAKQAPEEQVSSGYLLVPGVYLRVLLPMIMICALYFFMRGHNLPGGGFVAGLLFSVGIILQYLLAGTQWVESRMHLHPHRWLALGLLAALATGAGAVLAGYPFLTSHTAHLELPLLGTLHVPSAFVFDLGVFGVVVGATLLILTALAHQSSRAHRLAYASDNTPNQEEP